MSYKLLIAATALLMGTCSLWAKSTQWYTRHILSGNHAMVSVEAAKRYVLIPVEEKENIAKVRVIVDNKCLQTLNIRIATGTPDYYVPLDLKRFGTAHPILLDFLFSNNYRDVGNIEDFSCWQHMKVSDTFDTANREVYRPAYHHTPVWGWMNDPNGMFYQNGVWHLYFQYNPYGSTWENLSWGHATSRDLVHWKNEGTPIEPDALGAIFSGSAVVDSMSTAGFGQGAIMAMYTSAAESQTQSLAYSTDSGKTFTKYDGNPVLTATEPDFRDPKILWNDSAHEWNLIVSAGQKMNFYSSPDLKNWKYESSFGEGYGCHKGVWECPDLLKMPGGKWVLVVNINPGGPFGGSATQYFVGNWDGHRFSCDSKPETTKWMDYGKDHYATVTFSNAPNGRNVALPWMSNWQYAAVVPTMQYRSANGIPRDLSLFDDGDEQYLSVKPSPEVMQAFGKRTSQLSKACLVEIDHLRSNAVITLSNRKGEQVIMHYDAKARSFSVDRTNSGKTGFSDAFPCVTTAPTHGNVSKVYLFIDHSSIEVFGSDGKFAISNLVFPTTPYEKIVVKGGKYKIWEM